MGAALDAIPGAEAAPRPTRRRRAQRLGELGHELAIVGNGGARETQREKKELRRRK